MTFLTGELLDFVDGRIFFFSRITPGLGMKVARDLSRADFLDDVWRSGYSEASIMVTAAFPPPFLGSVRRILVVRIS